MVFPYTDDVRNEYPYIVYCQSENEAEQWKKYRWLVNTKRFNWGEDFIALYSPILSASRHALYDRWAFKDEKKALEFTLKWS